ncbi:hypothetical protein KEM56_000769 [Ascosphaera pollenicola]|nr:hypothetical protein KEM56_000769 [Ascosphaera pollenicola]
MDTCSRTLRRRDLYRIEGHDVQEKKQLSKDEASASSWSLTGNTSTSESIWKFAKGYMYAKKALPICLVILSFLLVKSSSLRKSNATFEDMLSIMPSSQTTEAKHSTNDEDDVQASQPLTPASSIDASADIRLAEALFSRQIKDLGLRPAEEPSHRPLYMELYNNHVNRCIALSHRCQAKGKQ